jgi:glycosyltransferase involved in cell wall biosynthesis
MARPVVGTGVGGLPEVVVHEKTGLLVPREDSDALAEAVAFLLDHPQTAADMGEAGRRRVARKFCWERYVDAYDALYQKMISKKSPADAI